MSRDAAMGDVKSKMCNNFSSPRAHSLSFAAIFQRGNRRVGSSLRSPKDSPIALVHAGIERFVFMPTRILKILERAIPPVGIIDHQYQFILSWIIYFYIQFLWRFGDLHPVCSRGAAMKIYFHSDSPAIRLIHRFRC